MLLGLTAAGALAVSGIAMAATTSTFSFKMSPSQAPKTTYTNGSLLTNLVTHYTTPGNNVPGGAVERTQIYLDKNFKINPNATAKCNPQALASQTMKGAMAACSKSLVGKGSAQATANGAFLVNGCVLLFNGKPQGSNPTLQVFTRVQVGNPSKISCANPSQNTQGNSTILLTGVLKNAPSPYGKVLDVDHITDSAALPLTIFKTTIGKGNYISVRCNAADKLWRTKTTWTYNDNKQKTVSKTQPCTVKNPPPPTPPDTKITKAKINNKDRKAKFTFKGEGDTTGFQCALKGKQSKATKFKSCNSPKVYKHLKPGKYTFKVRAVGPGGKDPSPAKKGFKIK